MKHSTMFEKFSEIYDEFHTWDNIPSLWVSSKDSFDWTCVEENLDTYDLLVSLAAYSIYGKAILVTHGWAAPLIDNSDIPPSQSPDKKRVRIYLFVEDDNFISGYQHQGDCVISVSNEAQGNIVDTTRKYIKQAKVYLNNQNTIEDTPF